MKRVVGLDIIKALAAFFVIALHFLLNTNFYQMSYSGKGMIVLSTCKNLFHTCIPLFLIATGYLNKEKVPKKDYYKGLKKVIVSYIFFAVVYIIIKKYYFGIDNTILEWIRIIFDPTANGYAWYIEMYIGLFLLIPYLNILYRALNTKEKKTKLIFTLILLTAIPSIFCGIRIGNVNLNLFPNWWTTLYPITYYYIGKYIVEYKPKLKTKKLLLYIILILIIHTLANGIASNGIRFSKTYMYGCENILTLVLSTMLFLLLYDKDIKNKTIKKIVATASMCSLDIFLISYLIDIKIYNYLKPILDTPKEHVIFLIPTIFGVFAASFILSCIKRILFNIIEKSKKEDKSMEEKIGTIIRIIKNTGTYLLVFLAATITISSVSHLLQLDSIKYNLLISLVISSIILFILNRKNKLLQTILPIILSLIIIIFGVVINQNYFDLSWDGNSYHKDAVGLMKNNWNPIYDNYIEYYNNLGNRNMDFIGDKIELTHGFWQTYYAKATWHIGASFYALTNNIESGKIYNILGIFITFSLVLYVLYELTHKASASAIIALLLSLNPISIVQCFNYYNDGFMGNLLMTLIFYMTVFALDKKETNKKELYTIVCSLLLILINIKFTGFGYAGIFCVPYFLVFVYKKIKERNIKEIIKSGSIFAITVLFSVCIVGYSPYITNIKEGLPIFYPLMGKNKVDIVTHNQTVQFNNKSTIYKFAKSMMSEVANMNQASGLKPNVKIPFSIKKQELILLNAPDLRISGFGPLFSGIFIISVIVITIYIVRSFIKKNKYIIYEIIPMMTSMILVLCISESWWARYSQYLYLVPISALILCLIDKSKIKYVFTAVIVVPLIINTAYFIEYNTLYNYNRSQVIKERLKSLEKKEIIVIDTKNEFVGMMYNFEDSKIKFITTTLDKENKKELYMWNKYIEKEND